MAARDLLPLPPCEAPGHAGLSPGQLRAVFDGAGCGLVVQDAQGRIVEANAAAQRMLGLSRAELLDRGSVDPRWCITDGQGRRLAGEEHPSLRTLRTGLPVDDFEMGVQLPDGQRRWIVVNTSLLPGGGDGADQVVACFVENTARHEIERAQAAQWQRLRATLEGTRTAAWEWNVQSGEARFDERWAQIVGWRLEELQPLSIDTWTRLVHPDDLAASNRQLQRHFAGEVDYYDIECRMRHKDGSWRWVHDRGRLTSTTADGRPLWMVGTHVDITERKQLQLELVSAANQDRLTGLPNRHALMQRLEQLCARARSDGQFAFAVLFLDFDRFKLVNDTLGHAAGDELLCAVDQRLQLALPQPATGWLLARFGGDEFVLLAPMMRMPMQARAFGQRLLRAMAQPYTLRGKVFHSSASVGVAFSQGRFSTPDTLLRDADTAMYEAKRAGRGALVVFDDTMRSRLTRAVQIEAALHLALARQQMMVLYQPIIDLDSGRLSSAEALMRWRHPELGAVSPAEFVPIAEESGHVIALGEWVLRQSCLQWARWQAQDAAAAPASVSVNLSRVQLALGPALIDTVRSALADAGMPPQALQLEVTEREIMKEGKDTSARRALMLGLRELGVLLAMDDFGTGASSLACLREYPFHTIKIDKSFVTDLCHDRHVMAVAHATVNVIVNLGMVSVAEGIEEPSEVAALQSLGCRYGQGYLFGRPMPGDQLLQAMAERQP